MSKFCGLVVDPPSVQDIFLFGVLQGVPNRSRFTAQFSTHLHTCSTMYRHLTSIFMDDKEHKLLLPSPGPNLGTLASPAMHAPHTRSHAPGRAHRSHARSTGGGQLSPEVLGLFRRKAHAAPRKEPQARAPRRAPRARSAPAPAAVLTGGDFLVRHL